MREWRVILMLVLVVLASGATGVVRGQVAGGPVNGEAGGMAPELLIRNGTIYDGTGGALRRADLLIRAGRIVGIGRYPKVGGRMEIDAAGRALWGPGKRGK